MSRDRPPPAPRPEPKQAGARHLLTVRLSSLMAGRLPFRSAPERRHGLLITRRASLLALALVGIVAAGCTETRAFRSSPEFVAPSGPLRVLLMPPDIEVSELTAGGLSEPKAEWTEAAKNHVTQALDGLLRARNTELVRYDPPAQGSPTERLHNQLIKLHDAVGGAILMHKYVGFELPTKKDTFDWSLGNGVNAFREEYQANYALFVFLRDSYSSSGRVAVMAVAALFGVGVRGGVQIGFASLVDCQSGDVVWFNQLISGVGDLRTPGPARKAVERLLADFPL